MADREQEYDAVEPETGDAVPDGDTVPGSDAEEVRPALDEALVETPGDPDEEERVEGEQFAETGYYGDIVDEPLKAESDLGLRDEEKEGE